MFKMAILTKFFDDLMNHIAREYAGKKMKSFLNVSPLTIVNLLLWPFKVSSLYFSKSFIGMIHVIDLSFFYLFLQALTQCTNNETNSILNCLVIFFYKSIGCLLFNSSSDQTIEWLNFYFVIRNFKLQNCEITYYDLWSE